jgi:transposase
MKKVTEKTRRVYSAPLKLHVVSEIENGSLSLSEASRRYSIPITTIQQWLSVHGKKISRLRVIEVTMKDQDDKIRELQKALSDAHLKLRIYEKMIEFAQDEEGLEIKKKALPAFEWVITIFLAPDRDRDLPNGRVLRLETDYDFGTHKLSSSMIESWC